jgi:hypothetical protein
VELYLHSHNIPSWRDAQLKAQRLVLLCVPIINLVLTEPSRTPWMVDQTLQKACKRLQKLQSKVRCNGSQTRVVWKCKFKICNIQQTAV